MVGDSHVGGQVGGQGGGHVGERLRVVDVTKRYGDRLALRSVSLEVEAGEIVAVLGPNGAGKSTLVSIVAGLVAPDGGHVRVCGHDVGRDRNAALRHVGIAPQETGLFESLTVRENLRGFAALQGLRGAARAARLEEVSEAFRIVHLAQRPVQMLSGGERRRVHTAIAFLHRPSVLLLDEPTVGADVETRRALLDVVRAAAGEGAAVVYSTHYLPEVETLDARVVLLVEGSIIEGGRLDELVARHARATVELTFTAAPPAAVMARLSTLRDAQIRRVDDAVVHVDAMAPGSLLPSILHALGSDADLLAAVASRPADLDSVFLSLTGRRFEPEVGVGVAAP
jgi:ABC-2 type transport system ATP-binding protein